MVLSQNKTHSPYYNHGIATLNKTDNDSLVSDTIFVFVFAFSEVHGTWKCDHLYWSCTIRLFSFLYNFPFWVLSRLYGLFWFPFSLKSLWNYQAAITMVWILLWFEYYYGWNRLVFWAAGPLMVVLEYHFGWYSRWGLAEQSRSHREIRLVHEIIFLVLFLIYSHFLLVMKWTAYSTWLFYWHNHRNEPSETVNPNLSLFLQVSQWASGPNTDECG